MRSIVSYEYTLRSGKPYCFCHFFAFSGSPVTMPASLQCFVFFRAGAI